MTESHAAFDPKLDRVTWRSAFPFVTFHLVALGAVFVTGVKWEWALIALVSYYVRMFGVTAGYHRYFSHRAFKTNRVFQFCLAWLAEMSQQKGVLWWAAHHRHHHRESDQPDDLHSPVQRGFWWSHVGWLLAERNDPTRFEAIKDFARFPELVWLNRFWVVPGAVSMVALFAIGGLPLLTWGWLVPTVLLWHGTFTINSLSHIFGKRRYLTTDTSRNNWVLALLTCGEGWHNNHHYHQNTANQGWFWWEIDLTFYALKALSWVGVVSDLRLPRPETKLAFEKYTEVQRRRLRDESRFGAGSNPTSTAAPTPTPEPMPLLLQPLPAPAKS